MIPPASAPLAQKERIQIIDTVRGIALLGILMMNIPYFSNPEVQSFNLNVKNEYHGVNYYTWWTVNGLFEGTMRALFSMLFGAGSILLLSRLEKRNSNVNAADIYYRRLLWLFLFGMINAFIFLWPGDILYSYAICGLVLFPFRNMKARHLFLIGIAFLLCGTAKRSYEMFKYHKLRTNGEKALLLEKQKSPLTADQKEAKEKWVAFQDKQKIENLKKEAQKDINGISKKGYFGTMGYLSSINTMIQSKIFYHYYFFDIICLLFLGMAFYKWKILTGERSKRFYWTMLATCYGIGLPLSFYEHYSLVAVRFDRSLLFERFIIDIYEERRIIMALGHLSVIMLLYKYQLATTLRNWLSSVGQMAFTNYLMQSLICSLIFYGYGFGLYGKLERYQEYYVVFCVWIFQIIFSNIWLYYFRFGPFEWTWRSLTYWSRQPMKRHSVTAEKGDEGETVAPAIA